MREFLAGGPRFDDYTRVPRTTWRLLADAPGRATFGSPLQPSGIYIVDVWEDAGTWTVRGDHCMLVREGLSRFGLAGEARDVLAVRPLVVATRRSVTVRLRVDQSEPEPPPPGPVCPGIAQETVITVPLGRRLGRRAVYDGSTRPKRLPRSPVR